jgi:hypothetical protein
VLWQIEVNFRNRGEQSLVLADELLGTEGGVLVEIHRMGGLSNKEKQLPTNMLILKDKRYQQQEKLLKK